jgi:4-hydroxybenzoate polyprenyltransferase
MIATLFNALRVYQWPKNLVVFGALVFALELDDSAKVIKTIIAFAVLCAASSAVYVLNDIIDIDKDRRHPDKRNRPVASGALSIPIAGLIVAVLAGSAIIVAFLVHYKLGASTIVFLLVNLAYTLVLKNIMLVDVLTIAVSFVIRGIAGALVIDVEFSNWLVVCTLFLALFLALGKRRREIGLLEEEAIKHREVLGHYTVPYLDALMVVLAGYEQQSEPQHEAAGCSVTGIAPGFFARMNALMNLPSICVANVSGSSPEPMRNAAASSAL